MVCNIHCSQYTKTNKSDNSNKVNTKSQDKDNDDDEKKDGLDSAHISMENVATIPAIHTLNDIMWEKTDDDDIGLLVGKEDLVCCRFNTPHLEESDNKYDSMSKLDQTSNAPMVKTVEEEHAEKFLFNNAEELFPLANIKPTLQPAMHTTEPV